MMPTNPLSPPGRAGLPAQSLGQRHQRHPARPAAPCRGGSRSCPSLRSVVLARSDSGPEGVTLFDTLVGEQSDELAGTDLEPLDEAAIMYTSGTTSLPKGVLVTHANYVFLGEVLAKNMRMGPDDRQLVTLPLFHANAQYYSFMSALTAGASAALMPRFSASRFMKQAIRYECTITSLFAAPMRMMLAQPRDPHDRQNSFRLVIFAQNITETQLAEWDDRFGASLMQIYGMTEDDGPAPDEPPRLRQGQHDHRDAHPALRMQGGRSVGRRGAGGRGG